MRGAQDDLRLDETGDRIIPADAGSTIDDHICVHAVGDHPRGCGEHGVGPDELDPDEGSSPRMRGAPGHLAARQGVGGIIPADAGSTLDIRYFVHDCRDHPRGCGEHWM